MIPNFNIIIPNLPDEREKYIAELSIWNKLAQTQVDLNIIETPFEGGKMVRWNDYTSIFMASLAAIGSLRESIYYKRTLRFVATYKADTQNFEALAMFKIVKEQKCLNLMAMATNPKNLVAPTNPQIPVRGAGSSLIGKLISICQAELIDKIWLISDPSACGFYEKLGFTRIESTRDIFEMIIKPTHA